MKAASIIFTTFALAIAIGAVLGGRIPIGSQSVDPSSPGETLPSPGVVPESPSEPSPETPQAEVPESEEIAPTEQPSPPQEAATTPETQFPPQEAATTTEAQFPPQEAISAPISSSEDSIQARAEDSTSPSPSQPTEQTTQRGRTSGKAIPALW